MQHQLINSAPHTRPLLCYYMHSTRLGAFCAENRNAALLGHYADLSFLSMHSARLLSLLQMRARSSFVAVWLRRLFALDFRFALFPKRGHVMHDSHLRPRGSAKFALQPVCCKNEERKEWQLQTAYTIAHFLSVLRDAMRNEKTCNWLFCTVFRLLAWWERRE